MSQTKSKERESVDSFLDAIVSGKVRINPDGWRGSETSVVMESPAEFLSAVRDKFKVYAKAEESEKEQLAKQLYGSIISARLTGLIVGETGGFGEVERLTQENQKLRTDLKKLLAATTGQDATPDAGPYQ